MFHSHPYAWMKAGNLLASLASHSPEYLALAHSVCPRRLLLPLAVSTARDTSSGIFLGFCCMYSQQAQNNMGDCYVCAVQ